MPSFFTATSKNRKIFLAVSLLAYVLLFAVIGRKAGHGAILALLPVLTAALLWGWRGGLAAGLGAFPLNMFMMTVAGLDWKPGMLSSVGIIGHIAFLVEGVFVGWIRDLSIQRRQANDRLQQEIARRARDIELLRSAEERLQTIIQESVDAIVITGEKMSGITMVNQAFLDLVGRPPEEVIGGRLFDFMPVALERYETVLGDELIVDERNYDDMLAKMEELVEHGRVSNWEFFLLNGRGRAVPLDANAVFIDTQPGRQQEAVIVFHDVTHCKCTEREMERANDFLENIIDNSLDGIMISDATGHIINVNQAVLELMGYEREELLGLTPVAFAFFDEGMYETTAGERVFVSQKSLQESYARMESFFSDGHINSYGYFIKRKDGRLVAVEANIVMLHSPSGEPVGAVSIMRDVTARRRMEQEMVQQRDQLAAANRELESFSYSVSHDLRAPLRSISGFSTALDEDFGSELPAEARRYLERIHAGAGRMAQLIDDLLQLSRLSRYDMRREQVSLSALAAEVEAQLREQDQGRNVACTIEPGLVVQGDGHLLRIAVENLLGNAWKYTGTRSSAEIHFGAASGSSGDMPESADGARVYCMRDNGVGFDMAYADKLFGAFQRLHGESEFPGSGIGLATVQRIVHRHGGRIWAKSAPEAGAAFYFTLEQEAP